MVATLSRAGTGWSLSDQRSYDAWGQVRAGVANGDPSGRYCANLGHKQDDESGPIYMRARYYEPGSGRFISEDPGKAGLNWFVYASNGPTMMVDQSGKIPLLLGAFLIGFVGGFVADMFLQMFDKGLPNVNWTQSLVTGLTAGAVGLGLTLAAGFVATLSAGAGIAGVLAGLSTAAEGATFAQILGGGAMGGLITAAITQALKGVAGAVAAVFARNMEVALILATD